MDELVISREDAADFRVQGDGDLKKREIKIY